MPTPRTYGTISRLNHWIIAIAMIGMLAFGLYLSFGGLPREAKGPLMAIHKSIGVLILIFGIWRVGFRMVQGFPAPLPSTGPAWQMTAAKITHWVLLAAILLLPISGIAGSVFRGRAVDVFGWFSIPARAESATIAQIASNFHGAAGKVIAALVLIHIAAALKHHYIDKDATLRRMTKGDSA